MKLILKLILDVALSVVIIAGISYVLTQWWFA